jgi:hypothetical protein
LIAQDILDGNYLLSDWNLTGATFLFSEVPFYLIGVLLFGVSTKAYLAASWLMALVLFLLGFLTLKGRKGFLQLFLYFALAAFPGTFLIYSARAHVGIFVLCFLALLCLDASARKNDAESFNVGTGLFYFLLIVLGTASDLFIIPVLVLPVLIYCFRGILSNRDQSVRLLWKWLGITLAGVLTGWLLERLILSAGGAELNSRIGVVEFTPLASIPQTLQLFTGLLLELFNAGWDGLRVFSIQSVFLPFRIAVLVLGIWALVRSLKEFASGNLEDRISILISLGIVCQTGLLIFLPFVTGRSAGRYFSYFPIAFAVLILRRIEKDDWLNRKICQGQGTLKALIFPFALILLISGIRPLPATRIVSPQDQLATFLRERQLTDGYADFWQANHVAVASEGSVRPRAISFDAVDGAVNLHPDNWFNKNSWYQNPQANFIVVMDGSPSSVNESNIRKYIGTPQETLRLAPYSIYLFPEGSIQP